MNSSNTFCNLCFNSCFWAERCAREGSCQGAWGKAVRSHFHLGGPFLLLDFSAPRFTQNQDMGRKCCRTGSRGNFLRSCLQTKQKFGQCDSTTRVPQARSCPARGWSGAGVGVGMLRGAGDSLFLKIKKLLGFIVSKFQGFWVPEFQCAKCQSSKVSHSQSFKVSKVLNLQKISQSSTLTVAYMHLKLQTGCVLLAHT